MEHVAKKAPISVIILTKNEELHIGRCLSSICRFVPEIFIVDSYSTDSTLQIASRFTTNVYQRPWDTYASQFNWALSNLDISQPWVMRLDADEFVRPELAAELCSVLSSVPHDVSGLYVRRRVYFMNRWIRHGGYYPIWLLRLWRHGKGVVENRWMDEHVVLSGGRTVRLHNDIEERNLQNLSSWINKHNAYATREAADLANDASPVPQQNDIHPSLFASQERRKRWLKENVYIRSPLFLRSFCYFFYRYVIRSGFLDGKEGFIFHFLQACWYRFLVDAKLYERRSVATTEVGTPTLKYRKEEISFKS